jgi:hypothetical protein
MAAVIQAPPAIPPRLSLLDAADLPNDPLEAWANPNVQLQRRSCTGSSAFTFDPCSADQSKPAGERTEITELQPFGIGYVFECSSLGGWTPADYRTRAREEFDAWEPKLIERQVQNASAVTSNLDLEAAETVFANALDPVPALGCLLQALRDCGHGGTGMIHATSRLVNVWKTNGNVDRANRWKGDLVYTVTDDIVVPGSGYDGSAPDGKAEAPNVEWAYATRIVQIRRTPAAFFPDAGLSEQEWMRQALGRTVNTIRVQVERAVLATWDPCCVIAVPVNLTDCPAT